MSSSVCDEGFYAPKFLGTGPGTASTFNAGNYSFFADLDAGEELELDGALEEGLDAPPEEEFVPEVEVDAVLETQTQPDAPVANDVPAVLNEKPVVHPSASLDPPPAPRAEPASRPAVSFPTLPSGVCIMSASELEHALESRATKQATDSNGTPAPASLLKSGAHDAPASLPPVPQGLLLPSHMQQPHGPPMPMHPMGPMGPMPPPYPPGMLPQHFPPGLPTAGFHPMHAMPHGMQHPYPHMAPPGMGPPGPHMQHGGFWGPPVPPPYMPPHGGHMPPPGHYPPPGPHYPPHMQLQPPFPGGLGQAPAPPPPPAPWMHMPQAPMQYPQPPAPPAAPPLPHGSDAPALGATPQGLHAPGPSDAPAWLQPSVQPAGHAPAAAPSQAPRAPTVIQQELQPAINRHAAFVRDVRPQRAWAGHAAAHRYGFKALEQRSGTYMSPEDVDYIVRSMLLAVSASAPYQDDYYFQAFLHKHLGAQSGTLFSPAQLPASALEGSAELQRLDPHARVRHVDLQGLGKVVYSSLRAPKAHLDLSQHAGASHMPGSPAATSSSVAAGTDVRSARRPLSQEPRLAARLLVEDCLALLMDVQDLDRVLLHGLGESAPPRAVFGAPEPGTGAPAPLLHAAQLWTQRMTLLKAVVAAFQLPAQPELDLQEDGYDEASMGDRLLLSILDLPKGRAMVARALQGMAAAPARPVDNAGQRAQQLQQHQAAQRDDDVGCLQNVGLPLLWAVLRNAHAIFSLSSLTSAVTQVGGGDPQADRMLAEATSRIAQALAACMSHLRSDVHVVQCLQAFTPAAATAVAASAHELPAGRAAGSKGPAAVALPPGVLPLALWRDIPGLFSSTVTAASFQAASAPAAAAAAAAAGKASATGKGATGSALAAAAAQDRVEWLGEALAALLNRAGQLGLREDGELSLDALLLVERAASDGRGQRKEPLHGLADEAPLQRQWRAACGALHTLVLQHLRALREAASGAAPGLGAGSVARLACRPLIQALVLQGSDEEKTELRAAMQRLM